MNMQKVQKGFTLIELMIVVAIIGILAAVAIPQYQQYVMRSKWASVMSSADTLKTSMAECAQNNGGDGSSCNTAAQLNVASVPTSVGPTGYQAKLTLGGTVATNTNGAGTGGTLIMTFDGSGVTQLGKCKVVETGTIGATGTTWGTVTSGTGCAAPAGVAGAVSAVTGVS